MIVGKIDSLCQIDCSSADLICNRCNALLNLFVIFGSIIQGDPGVEENIGSFGNIRQAEYAETIQEQFFAEGYEDSFFYRYFAK